MKIFAAIAFAGLAGLFVAGSAEAMPIATAPLAGNSAEAPIVKTAVVTTTKRVVRGPMGGRRVVTTRHVTRRGPMGGRVVTTTRSVR